MKARRLRTGTICMAALVAAALLALGTAPAATVSGSLRYRGCVANGGANGCVDPPRDSLRDVAPLALSADGKDLYVGGHNSVTDLKRNKKGRLAFGSCVADNGAYGCRPGATPSLADVFALAASPDGRSVYAGSNARRNAVTVFKRRPNGALKYSGCVADGNHAPGTSGCSKATHPSLNTNYALTVSPDGKNLYVASAGSSSLTTFSRAADGTLTYKQCLSNSGRHGCDAPAKNALSGADAVAVSPDGETVYLGSDPGDAVAWFHRKSDGTLTFRGCAARKAQYGCRRAPAPALDGPSDLAFAPSGKFIYVSASDGGAVSTFGLTGGGALRFRGCLTGYASQSCARVPGNPLSFPEVLRVSADGRWLYAASVFPGTLSTYRLGKRGLPSYKTCFRDGGKGGCRSPRKPSIGEPFGLEVGADPSAVYVAGSGVSTLTR